MFAGAIAGFAASIVMTESQKGWRKAAEAFKNAGNGQEENAGGQNQQKEEGEDATVKAASKLASLAGRELAPEQKTKAGSIVHYGFGTAVGALYGAAMELVPRRFHNVNRALSGSGFGSALFVGAHEIAVPALGLSASPTQEPLSDHFREWILHLTYGISSEVMRRWIRNRL
jgi:hypothetical protein